MRLAVLVLIVLAAAVAAQPRLVPVIPVPVTNNRAVSPPAPLVCAPTPRIDSSALWRSLTRMSPQERANAELVITANSPAAREIEATWNRGEYDAAIGALQRWAGRADLRHVLVGVNWRVPVQAPEADWGPNVRVGGRDSAYCLAFDRDNSTGNLIVASACLDSGNTSFVVDLSTDGGSTWAETHYGYWIGAAAVRDLEMAGSAGFEYLVCNFGTIPDSAYCYRINAATGAFAKMPDSTSHKTVLATSVPGDTLVEIAICSSDDQYPGAALYVVGGTRQHAVVAGYSYDQGVTWGLYTAVPDLYWYGLDYCYNAGGRYVFFSCMYNRADTLYPAYAYYDTVWNARYIAMPTSPGIYAPSTGIAAWRDTIFMVYSYFTSAGAAVRCLVSYDAFETYAQAVNLTDTTGGRTNLAVCGRLGDGVGVAWREYGAGGDRKVCYRHSDYVGTNWTGPDTVSELSPFVSIETQRVAPGIHGVCYVSWDTTLCGSIWFNRDDWGGIAGPTPERIVPMGLAAVTRRGGARLSFVSPVAGQVTLKVYDATGRRVRCRTEQLKPGAQTLDCAVPASGSYIAVLKTPAVTATTKFSTVR